MTPHTYKYIACGPTGNLQGSMKLYCLTTGSILKRRSFTPMPMPERVIKHVNAIGLQEKQGQVFRFVNRSKNPYKWTDFVLEDDSNFQGLLEEEEAPFPDISAELPGVPMEEINVTFRL